MIKTVFAGLVLATLIGLSTMVVSAEVPHCDWHHDSVALRMGYAGTRYHIEIKNRSSKTISIPTPMGGVSILATSVNLHHPLFLLEDTSASLKIGKPIDGQSGRFEFSTVNIKKSTTIKLGPGELLIVESDLRKMLKDDSWEWNARPKPPKSPIMNKDGSMSLEPIALWAEFPLGKGRDPLRTRPFMVSSQKLFGPAYNSKGCSWSTN